jgi:ATP-binding cassette subfamily C protein CydC
VAQNLEGNRTAALRLYELVDANPAVHDPSRPMTLPSELQLDFQHVSFQYPAPGTDNTIKLPEFSLKNISFSLPEGKQIAIVGQSGAGKTTLISLLQRFWDYDSGAILLGGEELRGYRQDEVRKQFAVVSQNTYIFSATIAENLLIAHPGAARDEIIAATQAAQLHDLIDSLPDGYNTWVGEHGLRLSAGERQRLAIARALLKNAPFLILDEPTANLDPVTESVVMKSIRELSRRRSVILITQRLVGLEAVDEILVLKDGQIIERGTHSDLIAIQGSYQRMWKIYNQII